MKSARDRPDVPGGGWSDIPVMQVETRNAPSAVVADANAFFLDRLGYSAEEVLGAPLASFYTPESAELLMSSGYHRALRGEFFAEERTLVAKDGTKVPALLHATPLEQDGEVVGTRAVFIDLSARRRGEELLRNQLDVLERAAEDAVANFAGEMAHELNNVLTIIFNAAISLTQYVSDEKARNELGALLHAADRATQVGRQLLARSKHMPPELREPASLSTRPDMAARILVVDDEPEIRRIVRRFLSREGFTVETAHRGDAALRLLLEQPPFDLILTDVVMPEMSGPELWSKIPDHRQPRAVLFMSGYIDQPAVRQAVSETGARFLQKPFMPDELLTLIIELLGTEPPAADENRD